MIAGSTSSDETKRKISESLKQIGAGKWMLGRKLSEETKKKISETQKRIGKKPPNPKGKKYTALHRKRMSKAQSGEKHWNWQGGISNVNKKIRHSFEYKLWREAIVKRDGYMCIWCGSFDKLQVDHIKPFALYPELRFAIDNGRTLCEPCHRTTDTWGKKKI